MNSDLVSILVCGEAQDNKISGAIGSARAQSHPAIEVIVLGGGSRGGRVVSNGIEGVRIVETQALNRAAVWNTGIAAARGEYVVPLPAGDRLDPRFVSGCVEALRSFPENAFVYSDYRSGRWREVRRSPEYDLYALLQRNILPDCALIRKRDLDWIGGYDEAAPPGFENWGLWLRLASTGRYGMRLAKPLLLCGEEARGRDRVGADPLLAAARHSFCALYTPERQAELKARWNPVACYVGGAPCPLQSIQDYEVIPAADSGRIQEQSRAPAFFESRTPERVDPHTAELAALSIWSGRHCVRFADGSIAFSRKMLAGYRGPGSLEPDHLVAAPPVDWAPGFLNVVSRHLRNAELLSLEAWRRRPWRSFSRLIPLIVKEQVNRLAGKPVFDLQFYFQFQPNLLTEYPPGHLPYLPQPKRRRRIAFITPHLGSGGAEAVLMEIARTFDRGRFELFVIATRSDHSQWVSGWKQTVDHVYDLARYVPLENIPSALYSVVRNWDHDVIVIQNSVAAYSLLPHFRKALPAARLVDVVHSVNGAWDLAAVTSQVSRPLDTRIVVSNAALNRLQQLGVEPSRIRLIRNGVDLNRFQPRPRAGSRHRILFAARLDPVKRPHLVVGIASRLRKLRGKDDFLVTVAGSGPELGAMRNRVRKAGAEPIFEFLGEIPDIAPILGESIALIVTSRNEGLPLVVLEAMAAGRPVVASNVGAIREAVIDGVNGFLVEPGRSEDRCFAESLARLMDDSSLRERLGAAARRKAEEEFGIDQAREAFRAVFNIDGGE